MALYSLFCAEVQLRNCSFAHSVTHCGTGRPHVGLCPIFLVVSVTSTLLNKPHKLSALYLPENIEIGDIGLQCTLCPI